MDEPRLTIELVPAGTWGDNVRSAVTKEQWDRIRRAVYKRAGYKCEICGGKGKEWPVECHEVWHYDGEQHIQKLVGLIALCPMCHKCKHMGFAFASGVGAETLLHLTEVNDWSVGKAFFYYKEMYKMWEQRSKYHWHVDISLLENYKTKAQALALEVNTRIRNGLTEEDRVWLREAEVRMRKLETFDSDEV